jgi:uncharacterized phiE125 gp8 family phage protein
MDSLTTGFIKSARSYIERETDRILMSETWIEYRSHFPMPLIYPLSPNLNWTLSRTPLLQYQEASTIRLPIGPVTAVTGIHYYDTSNNLVLLDPSVYVVMTPTRMPATLTPITLWPATTPRPDAVQITMTVGYSTLPDNIAQAVRALAATWFTYRESESEKTTRELNAGLQRIIEQVRLAL